MVVGSLQQYVPWHSKHVYTHTLTRHTCVTHDVITQDTLGIVRTVSITHLVYCGMYINIFPCIPEHSSYKFIASEAHSLYVILIQTVICHKPERRNPLLSSLLTLISMLTIKIQRIILIIYIQCAVHVLISVQSK